MTATAIPTGPRMPRAVQTLGWVTRPGPFLKGARDKYGDVFTLRIAQEGTWVFLSHPDAIKEVFTGDPKVLHAGEGNAVLRPILGPRSVLLLDDDAHMAQRKLLLPPFHGERMRRYGDLMTEIAEAEIERWPRGEPISLWPRMQAVTLEIILRAVFGIREADRLDRIRTLLKEALDWTTDIRRMVAMAALGPDRLDRLPLFRRALRPLDEELIAEIQRRRAEPDVAERDDILSLLVQARHDDGSPMGDEELRDELMTLLVAGHETTATALSWAVERLVRHPEMLARLTEEGDAGEDEYADAVTKETLRLRPVLPIVVRRLTEPLEIAGHSLPAGVAVAPCIYLVHRREDVYPEPERFRPERFLEQPAGTYTWIPFGGGVRRCLGATFALYEMKVVLGTLVRQLSLRPDEQRPERIARRAITLTPGRGARVVVEDRGRARLRPVPAEAAA